MAYLEDLQITLREYKIPQVFKDLYDFNLNRYKGG